MFCSLLPSLPMPVLLYFLLLKSMIIDLEPATRSQTHSTQRPCSIHCYTIAIMTSTAALVCLLSASCFYLAPTYIYTTIKCALVKLKKPRKRWDQSVHYSLSMAINNSSLSCRISLFISDDLSDDECFRSAISSRKENASELTWAVVVVLCFDLVLDHVARLGRKSHSLT